ncbi:MAG: hypothetical protein M1608_08940 [Candidatus Omnitrophica bacterium]|nr:hypothetical protein [Candidatus Omnitrophota bacterium]
MFDGVDFDCQVWLNGKWIGRNAGMFRRFWFDVTSAIQPDVTNRLAVRISRMPEALVHPLKAADGDLSGKGEDFFGNGQHKMLRSLKDLKSATNWGFDWGVNIWTLGIWKNVYLEMTGQARISWLQVQSRLSGHYRKAAVRCRAEIQSDSAVAARFEVRLRGHGSDVSKVVNASLKLGTNYVEAELTLDNPALWWPNGQGEQPLYDVEAVLKEAGGQCFDTKTTRIGVREIRWGQVEGAPTNFINPYRLFVNGQPVRMMGSNLIPPDPLFGRMPQRGLRLIELARAAWHEHIQALGWGSDFVRGDV